MNMPVIREATKEEADDTIHALVLGFCSDPVARWLWQEPMSYVKGMDAFARAYGGRAFEHNSAYVCEGFAGAALWLPPKVHPDETALEAVVNDTVHPSRQEDLVASLERLGGYHPSEEHWFLPLIAIDVAQQGRGLGAVFMKHALQRCDQDGTPAYLESSNPRNIAFYERHGFEALGEVQVGECPTFIPMVRPAMQ